MPLRIPTAQAASSARADHADRAQASRTLISHEHAHPALRRAACGPRSEACLCGNPETPRRYSHIVMSARVDFNPAVTLADAALGGLPWREVAGYVGVQVGGAFVGVALAHGMFGELVFSPSRHTRAGGAQFLSEFTATFGLMAVIWGVARRRSSAVPFAVAAYITAAYWFTGSTSFGTGRDRQVLGHPPDGRSGLPRGAASGRGSGDVGLPLVGARASRGRARDRGASRGQEGGSMSERTVHMLLIRGGR